MKKLTLISYMIFSLIAVETLGSENRPPIHADIVPPNPTSSDVIEITLSGDWPDSCIPTASTVLVSGRDIFFDVIINTALMRPCILVVTPWQQTQLVGPLSPGTYTLYARYIDYPLWGPAPVPVPDPKLYTLITEFGVTALGRKYTYIFESAQSVVVQTGGFAGIQETHTVEGYFQLTVDWHRGTASFVLVDATLSESPFLYTRSLDELFNMTKLLGTVVSGTAIEFAGQTEDGTNINLRLTFMDGSVHLTGEIIPDCCDRFNYHLNAVAMRESDMEDMSWIAGVSGPRAWTIEPNKPTTSDLIHFSGPTSVFGNACLAKASLGGTPTLTLDSVNKTIELWFQPPAPELCPRIWAPVCGLKGTFGPLAGGQWLFFCNNRYANFSISFRVNREPAVYYVDATSGNDNNDGLTREMAFATIQKGIDTARDGDTVIVQPGLYEENINLLGKNIILTSTDPSNSGAVNSTTIDGVVSFRGTEDASCALMGFDIDGYIIGFDYRYGRHHTHATIRHCVLENIVTGCGGVIQACDGIISNCVVANVSYLCLRPAPVSAIRGCHGLITNCTLVNIADGIEILEGGTCTIENCIVYDRSLIIVARGATVNILYTDFQGGRDRIFGGGIVNWGPGNIDTDPCFVRLGSWEVEGDYHLKSQAGRWDPNSESWVQDDVTSPCIDAGNPENPIGEELFPNGGILNMGAYGGTAEASKSYFGEPVCETIVAGDINGDCKVDFADLGLMALHWLEPNNE